MFPHYGSHSQQEQVRLMKKRICRCIVEVAELAVQWGSALYLKRSAIDTFRSSAPPSSGTNRSNSQPVTARPRMRTQQISQLDFSLLRCCCQFRRGNSNRNSWTLSQQIIISNGKVNYTALCLLLSCVLDHASRILYMTIRKLH